MRLEHMINPRKVGLILGFIALYLAAQSIFNEYLLETFMDGGSSSFLALVLDLFSVNLEESVPTWYSTLNLFIAAGLLAIIALFKRASRDRYRFYWLGLAVIFLYLSMDEGAAIHEIFSDSLQETFNTSGYLTFGWQITAVPLVIIFAVLYLRFLLHLPARTRNLFVLAALLYAGGALVIEGISANQYDLDGGATLTYLSIATVEEFFEMIGVVIFIYTLLAYIVEMQYTLAFQSHPTTQGTSDAVPAADDSERAVRFTIPLRPLLLLLGMVVLGVNLTLFYLARAEGTASEADTRDSTLAYQMIIDDLATDTTVITYVPGAFGPDNLASRQVAAALLNLYDDVMVLTLPEIGSSIVIAGDPLPFDRDSLTEVLHDNGETQFIIFETPIVSAIAGGG